MTMTIGECDCCGKSPRLLHKCQVMGIETAACALCGASDPAQDAAEINEEIERVINAGNVEDRWDYLCTLHDAALVLEFAAKA